MKYLIGIDAGTSKVKVVLFDLEGNEVRVEARDNEPMHLSGGCIEQDMNILWEKVLLCLTNLFNEDINPNDVVGIGVTGQGEGCWLIDGDGKPVDNSMLWCDGRAGELVNEVTSTNNNGEDIYKTTGTQMMTGAASTLLKWTKLNKKENLDKASNLLFCKDWIRYKLTNNIKLEMSDTGTSLININNKKIADEVLEILDIKEYKHLLSEVLKSTDIAGYITKDIATKTGIPEGTPVCAGAIDVVAAAVGIGAINNGDICTILGTTCSNTIVVDKIEPGKECTRFEMHAVDELYVNLQATMSGTPNIDWALNNISETSDFKVIDENISDIEAGCGGVLYHPYIGVAGERAPFYNSNARASFFGLSTETTRWHLVKAVYEGIAFSIKDCLVSSDCEESGKIYLAGGGAKSSTWAQIIADCTNREVITSFGDEFAAKGAAMIAGYATNNYSSFEEAVIKSCKHKNSYMPNDKNVVIYDELYKVYREFREVNEKLYNDRAKVLKLVKNLEQGAY